MSPNSYSYAIRLLARREHSKLELEQKLAKKDFAMEDIIKTIHDLETRNLQSDERFTESYINMRTKRGFGPIRIKAELKERGVDQETIDRFLAEHDQIWYDLAQNIRYKKFGKKITGDWQEQAKQMRYLHHKGFDNDQIKKIIHSHNGTYIRSEMA